MDRDGLPRLRLHRPAMTRGDRLGHSWRAGKLLLPGLASDYAAMIRAALALHEATGTREYLFAALAWQAALDRHYAHYDNGGYFLTANDAEGLVVRPDSTLDEAIPNPAGLAAQNLIRLAILSGDDIWRSAPTSCSTACCRLRRRACISMRACSTPSTCGCAPSRSSRWARKLTGSPTLRSPCPISTVSWRVLGRQLITARASGTRSLHRTGRNRRAHMRRRTVFTAGDRGGQAGRAVAALRDTIRAPVTMVVSAP